MVTTQTKATKKSKNSQLYALIWRWHFIMGLLITPILCVVAITGALYVFSDELETILYAQQMKVTPLTAQVSLDEEIAAVKQAYPDMMIHYIAQEAAPERSHRFYLEDEAENAISVYVNQYTGEVLGEVNSIFRTLLNIHMYLFAGTVGNILVEISVAWAVVSLLTGFFLWLPRRKEKIRGVLRPRLKGNKRLQLRDLHTVPSFYFLGFALLIMLTGLVYTLVSGTFTLGSLYVTKQLPEAYVNPPHSSPQDSAPIPASEALASYQARNPIATKEFGLDFPHDAEGTYTLTANFTHNHGNLYLAHIDQFSGELLSDVRWKDVPWGAKIFLHAYPVHTGSIYGVTTKILAVVTALLIAFMSISGVLMWWWRRPKGKLGVPQSRAEAPRALVVLIIVLGFLLPMVGLSLLLILAGSWLQSVVKTRVARA